MNPPAPLYESERSTRRTALSLLLPGAGQLVARRARHGSMILFVTVCLLAAGVAIGRTAGASAEVFYFVLFGLPWWLLQAYDAGLNVPDSDPPLRASLRRVLDRALDVRYLGLLFLLTALMDLYIILVNPDYALALFCAKPKGLVGLLAKIQSPTIHLLIGVGFLGIRRWALLLYLAYAAFGFLNATANFACFGYGRVRMVFALSLVAFTAYIWSRRRRFV